MAGAGYGSYAVFISSPGGLENERDKVRRCIGNMNAGLQRLYSMSLVVNSWEDLPPSPADTPDSKIQEHLNTMIEQCHFFIIILHDRYGSVEEGFDISNTEREIDAIYRKHQANHQVKILSYLKKIDVTTGASDQTERAIKLRNKVQQISFMTKSFIDINDFNEKIINDLYQTCIGLKVSTFKRQCLSRFFSIDAPANNGHRLSTDLAIIYRPIERSHVDNFKDTNYWNKRFMPKIFFEDSKAIQKIEKIIRLIGSRSSVHTDTVLPTDLGEVNKLYVCCPRIPASQKCLAMHTERRFDFKKMKSGESVLKWRDNCGNEISIRSPLPEYLKLQRSIEHSTNNWNAKLANNYARDYAVIARFAKSGLEEHKNSSVKEFYIAGIRGLGTWGAAWFLDRRYKSLEQIDPHQDIQMLLEIEYVNGGISDVKDVSSMDANYFKIRNKIARIREDVNEFIHGE